MSTWKPVVLIKCLLKFTSHLIICFWMPLIESGIQWWLMDYEYLAFSTWSQHCQYSPCLNVLNLNSGSPAWAPASLQMSHLPSQLASLVNSPLILLTSAHFKVALASIPSGSHPSFSQGHFVIFARHLSTSSLVLFPTMLLHKVQSL